VSVSPSGFRNIKPLSRHARRAQRDKVALEKERLTRRTGLEARLCYTARKHLQQHP